jgi:DNA-binding NarL/FixJ family response regulator
MSGSSSPAAEVSASRRIRVAVADPFPVIVHGVRTMVEEDPRLQVVAEACRMASLVRKAIAERPQVALMDWVMASQDLSTTTALLQSESQATSFVFLTVTENAEQQQAMLRLGARGVLSKWSSARDLQMAVWKACQGRAVMDSADAGTNPEGTVLALSGEEVEQRVRQLTRRERQLIPMVCSGLRNKEIAQQLGISESTVWHHLTAVFTKLQVEDRLGVAAFVYRHGLVATTNS